MSKIIDISVKKASFFNNYAPTKTSYDYNELIRTIRECAQHDMLEALKTKVDEEKTFTMITDPAAGAEAYRTPLTAMYKPTDLIYVNRSYIDSLVANGRIGLLITDKSNEYTKKTKENGYKLGLLKAIGKLIEGVESAESHRNRSFFGIFLNFLNADRNNKFAASLINSKERTVMGETVIGELETKKATAKTAEQAGPNLLDSFEEAEIKDFLHSFFCDLKAYIKLNNSYKYKYHNEAQAKIIFDLTREDLDKLEIV